MNRKIENHDIVLLLDIKDSLKRYLVDVSKGEFSTKHGQIDLTELIGKEFGIVVKTHLGVRYIVLEPTFYDRIMLGIKRQTQIVYPKDAGYIVLWLGLSNGHRVFECGAGSGAMTAVIANVVAPDGMVVSYENDERFFKLAQKNIERLGLQKNVDIRQRDLADGVDVAACDAAFIDVREPWHFVSQIWDALRGGATIAFVLPTTNQIQELLRSIEQHGGFADVRVAETSLRFYKPIADRLRPKDRMVAHTTYIVMCRKVINE